MKWFVSGSLVLAFGVFIVVRSSAIARWNDTRGPAWLRNYGGRAFPGRTKGWQVIIAGVLIAAFGVLLVAAGVAHV